MIVEGVLTRSGVFVYRRSDGSEFREFRPADEVFKPESLQSFAMVPVTDDHPSEMVTAKNAASVAVGSVGENIRQDGDFVVATLAINDASVVRKLEAGKQELSCGYICDLEETSGITPDGQHFDAIQRNIRGNHVAIVDVARAGPEARIRMDAAIMIGEHRTDQNMDPELKESMQECAKLQADLLVANQKVDKAEGERDAAVARADKAEGERDAATAATEESEKARTDAADNFGSAVQERVALEAAALKVLGEEFKCDGKSDREIKVAVIKVDCKDKSDDYVQARFDMTVDVAKADGKIYQGMSKVDQGKIDEGDDPVAAAEIRMHANNKETFDSFNRAKA